MEGYILELGGIRNGFFNRNFYFKIDENINDNIEKFKKNCNSTDVYYCLYMYENNNIEDCKIYAPLYLDIDANIETEDDYRKAAIKTARVINYLNSYFKIPINMIQLYFSGSKGFHIIVDPCILDIKPCVTLNIIYKLWAIHIAKQTNVDIIDTRIYDRRRLFRLPNTINSKSGLYKIPITLNFLQHSTLKDIKDLAAKPKQNEFIEPVLIPYAALYYKNKVAQANYNEMIKKNNQSIKVKIPDKPLELLPCIREVLSTGVSKGNRNNTTVALASALIQSGRSFEDTLEILQDWNKYNTPPLDEGELLTTAKSGYNLYLSGKAYGCATFKELGICVGSECKLNR